MEFRSDSDLMRTFERQRDEAEELVRMIAQEENCSRVDREGELCPTLSPERKLAYDARLEKLGAHRISRSPTFITIRLDHLCSGDKGLLYSEGQLPSVESLDEPILDNVAYRHLEGPWYLFVDRLDCFF
jgi:hypothetical protein